MAGDNVRQRAVKRYRDAVEAYRQGRLRFSQEFLLFKMQEGRTDRVADHMAIVATKDELSTLQAEKEIAKHAYESAAEGYSHAAGKEGYCTVPGCTFYGARHSNRIPLE